MSEHDKYPFVWTKVSIQTLFEILSGKAEEYKHARSLKQFYQSVAAVMREAGHNCHWEHLSGKVKTMRRAIKNAGSKNPSEDHLRRTVPYYDCVKDFLKLKRTPTASYKNGEKLSGDDSSDESGSDLDYESSEEEEDSSGTMPWNHVSTMALIMAYRDVYLKTKKSAYNSKKFWKIIQYNLKKQGFTQSLKACKGKFYKMRETFVRKARRASEGYGADKTWPFYDVMRSVVLARKKFDTKFSMLNASSTLDQYGWNTTSLDYELSKPRQLVHWDKDGMTLLVELIKERKPKFDNPLMYKKKDLWEEISAEVKKAGFSYNADSCDMKHKSLLRTYRATIRNNAFPGNTKKVCQFYSDFREMYPSSIVEPEVQKEIYKNLKRKREEIMSQPVKVFKQTDGRWKEEDEKMADSNSVDEISQAQADETPEVVLDVDLNDFEVKEEELDEECALSDEDESSHASVSTPTVPGTAGKTSGMFDWLDQYEARQEKRETNIYKRMEKMQNETVTVMKDLISKLKK